MNELKAFIKYIKERTGIKLSLYTENGIFLTGETKSPETISVNMPHGAESVKTDAENNATYFTVSHKEKIYIGKIDGCGDAEKNYALLISDLAGSFLIKEPDISFADFCRAIVFGEINYSRMKKYAEKHVLPEKPCVAMVINAENGKAEDVMAFLQNYQPTGKDFAVKVKADRCVFVKYTDDVFAEYRSVSEYAEILRLSLFEETGIKTKIYLGGVVKTVFDVSVSFSQATSACQSDESLCSSGDVHSFKDYVFVKILEDLPKHKLNEYLDVLMDEGAREVFADEEMVVTAEEFLGNSLNISETSRKLYLHRNTLMYRLDKIERLTGLNVRKFSDAVTFRLIAILSKMVK